LPKKVIPDNQRERKKEKEREKKVQCIAGGKNFGWSQGKTEKEEEGVKRRNKPSHVTGGV